MDFLSGLKTICGNGDPTAREGLAIHIYTANASMGNKAMCNNDGDLLILPQQGRLDLQTEFGRCVCISTIPFMFMWGLLYDYRLMVRPGELVVIQRGIKFKVF